MTQFLFGIYWDNLCSRFVLRELCADLYGRFILRVEYCRRSREKTRQTFCIWWHKTWKKENLEVDYYMVFSINFNQLFFLIVRCPNEWEEGRQYHLVGKNKQMIRVIWLHLWPTLYYVSISYYVFMDWFVSHLNGLKLLIPVINKI